jgi:hypothetical protein
VARQRVNAPSLTPKGRFPVQANPTAILVENLEPLAKITRDIRQAASVLTHTEARYLVDTYYQVQDFRIASAAQVRSLTTAEEPSAFVNWTEVTMAYVESQIKSALDRYTDQHPVGVWSKSIVGIGPVIAAGLLAHIDIRKAPTVGHIWRFAGLDPTVVWRKGEKRPWNADLKVICWKAGESFVKFQNHENDTYGKVYVERKQLEIERNERGDFAETASRILTEKKFRSDTSAKTAYEAGRLPDGHIHARAKRYAVKLFLSHWHHVAHVVEYGTDPPKPYIIEHGGHTHFLAPPNWP